MNARKTSITAGILALAAIAAAVYLGFLVSDGRRALSVATQQRDALRKEKRDLERRLQAVLSSARAADEDALLMLQAVEKARTSSGTDADAAITEEAVKSRFRRAQEMMRNGQWEAALPELLWCYDVGMARISKLRATRSSFLVGELGRLAKDYPPAMAALRERRDRMEERMLRDPADARAAGDVAALNAAIGDTDRNLVLFENLPVGDKRREGMLVRLYDHLLAERRYQDVVTTRSYAKMSMQFDRSSSFARSAPPAGLPPGNAGGFQQSMRQHVITTTARDIEALAGAGELDHARDLAQRLLAFDASAATRQLVQEHAGRANQPDLLKD